MLAHLLKASPEVSRLRTVVRKRLLDEPRIVAGEKVLVRMLITLGKGGYVRLEPEMPPEKEEVTEEAHGGLTPRRSQDDGAPVIESKPVYQPELAHPTEALEKVLAFRAIHPLYGAFLMDYLGVANREERLQLMESLLELPRNLLRSVRVPWPDKLPPGPLAAQIDPELVQRGLMAAPRTASENDDDDDYQEEPDFPLSLAEKMKLLFEVKFPEVGDLEVQSVWAAGELLEYGGNFTKYISGKDLAKQEGILFRHFLRLILLCGEFRLVTPTGIAGEEWQKELDEISDKLTAACRAVDPTSTDEVIQQLYPAVPVADIQSVTDFGKNEATSGFGEGIFSDPT